VVSKEPTRSGNSSRSQQEQSFHSAILPPEVSISSSSRESSAATTTMFGANYLPSLFEQNKVDSPLFLCLSCALLAAVKT
jgi:hypothetical protein